MNNGLDVVYFAHKYQNAKNKKTRLIALRQLRLMVEAELAQVIKEEDV
jgi:hypothetical protein